MMGYGMGHGPAIHAIVALVIATAFLVWVAGKEGNPYQKLGKVVGWIAFILSVLIVLGSVAMCINMCAKGGWPCMRGQMMQKMMEEGKMPMGPMMRGPHGMGPMGTPPPPEEKK